MEHALACGDLPWVLVQAIIDVESGGDPCAFRTEPHYRWFWDCGRERPFRKVTDAEVDNAAAPKDFDHYPEICSVDTEWLGQQCSWGPMQVMGAVARERGFDGPFPELCRFDDGVYWGCRHLQWLAGRYYTDEGWHGVTSAYNQGSPRKDDNGRYDNQAYVDRVFAIVKRISDDAQQEAWRAPAA